MVIKLKKIIDGNEAAAIVSYNFSELAGIYPITPASNMAENVDSYATENKLNFFGDKVKVIEMQSEAGAIATVHGALQNGVLGTTYTASQGLLLMLPNMYKIAGELLPCVINVAARTIATHALSIMGDHSDIYSTRSTGFAILGSSSVQQVLDLTNVAYLSTLKGRIPFVNFFDGFRTSHEYNTVDMIDFNKVKKLIDQDALNKFREKSLNIDNPTTRGTNQGDSIYFQAMESRNKFYNDLPDVVNYYMSEINKISNTNYAPFNYYGSKKATKVIVAMGSVCETIKETIDYLNQDIGLIEVHLYRPFSYKYFMNALPKTTKKIAVLDRTKEPGANGEPLYLDVVELINKQNLDIKVIGGRYGLSSKDTTPNDIEAVYNYLDSKNISTFTLGINDDVTKLSLKPTKTNFKNNALEMLIYGYGSDGMITTSKSLLTITGELSDKQVQGYFEYDSKKSGGVTKSHLRFKNDLIRSTYYVTNPSVIVVSKDSYLKKYNVLDNIIENGIFILNTSSNDLNKILTKEDIKILKQKNINFFVVDANKIAKENNIPNKISTIMETVIFKVTNMIDFNIALNHIKGNATNKFIKKGQSVVDSNINAINNALDSLQQIDINILSSNISKEKLDNTIFGYLDKGLGNEIKVSAFTEREDGVFEPGLSTLEKRGISDNVPEYISDKCIMCNLCSFVCPHAVIRPYLLTKEEKDKAPDIVKKDLKDANIPNRELYFTIGISQFDCTGCTLCESVCPTKAIVMKQKITLEKEKYEYLKNISNKDVLNSNTIKGSQFIKPKFEFPGACAGCGETAYLKLLSQIFNENLMIANATGCSSIYGASVPSTPYSVPWANSLFEDNAEFGFGIRASEDFMKDKIKNIMNNNYDKLNKNNKELVDKYINNYSKETSNEVFNNLDYKNIKELIPFKKYIKEKSIWLVGGDGWAYDIGFGGIDHVLANNLDVNILVLDTEVYSNTGGQASKSTRQGAVAKFAASGKVTAKKDLAGIAMTYPNVYVATISLGANYQQTINAINEANNHKGPSLIIAYAPCIAHGIKTGMKDTLKQQKFVSDSGYFPLYRYNPINKELKLDSKADFDQYDEIFTKENRYDMLNNNNKQELFKENKETAKDKYSNLEK